MREPRGWPHTDPEPWTGDPRNTGEEPGISDRVLAIIRNVDKWLDAEVSAGYQGQPLAQDWARVAKAAEEAGEAIDALIGCTGQNPRKGHSGTLEGLLGELGDVAVTGMLAIQHFTKDEWKTAAVIMTALEKAAKRAAEAGYDGGQR